MAWAALLIGLVAGVAILIGTITTRRPRLRPRLRTRVRRADRAPDPVAVDPKRLRTFKELRDELMLQAKLAGHLSSTAGHDGELDATLDEFRKASEAVLEQAQHKNGGWVAS